jgi:hypothetical protein
MAGKGSSGHGGSIVPRRLTRLVLIAFAAGVAALGAPAGAVAGTLDQSQTTFGTQFQFGGPRQGAQTFTAGLSGNLDQVDVHVRRNAAPAGQTCNHGSGITVEIRTVTGGVPSNTTLATASVPVASVPTTLGWVSLTFAAHAAVTAGTQYALVLSALDASCTGGFSPYTWGGANGNPYAGGAWYLKEGASSSWLILGDADGMFKTYVAPPPPPSDPAPPPSDPPPPSDGIPPTSNRFPRTLSIGYAEKKDKFRGKLTSQSPACISDQKVKVFEKKKGKDPKLGSDETNENGKYSLKETNAEGKFYAKVKQTSLGGSTCLAARSKTINVG